MDGFNTTAALDTFLRRRREGEFFPSEWEGKLTLEESYLVLLALGERLAGEGRRRIGWKVGLTAKPIQDQFNVHEPCFGFLLDDAPHASGAAITHESLMVPGFENELCVAMGVALAGPGVTPEAARAAVATVAPAFELIETRGDFRGHLEKVVPDNLQQKGVILGTPIMARDIDFAGVGLRVSINGSVVDEATGDAVLGDPINSVVWLANKLAVHGIGLASGDLIMTGSFTRQYAIAKGDVIHASFAGVGDVTASFP